MSLRVQIQRKIQTTLDGLRYYAVFYDKASGLPEISTTLVDPSSLICNELGCTFSRSPGRNNDYTINDWQFQAIMSFTREVDVTEALFDINLNFTYDEKMVIIDLNNVSTVQHPVEQGPHEGTEVVMNFTVRIKT